MKLSKLSIIIFSSSFLVACGGGGDAATGVAVGNGPVAAPVALNSSNKTIAAQETVSTALLPLDLAETLTGSQLTDESAIFKFAYAQQKKNLHLRPKC